MPPRTIQDEQWDALMVRIAQAYTVTKAEVQGPSKTLRIRWPRQVVCFLLRQEGWTLVDIGRVVRRDHSTVHHAISNVERRLRTDVADRRLVEWVRGAVDPSLYDAADLDAAIQRIDDAIARATLIRGVLVTRGENLRRGVA